MGRIKIILQHLLYLLFIPIWILQLLIPRKKNTWVFGAWHGLKFSDNSKALFLEIVTKHPEINAIWLTRTKEVRDELNAKGYNCYIANSTQGILKSLIAKIVIISSSKNDINPFFINGAKLIQIWHGAPMKKIGLSVKISPERKILLKIQKYLFPFIYEYTYNYVVSTSKCFDTIMSKAFQVPMDNIIKSGYPRNDIFFKDKQKDLIIKWNTKFNNPKKIMYLPTFRSRTENTDFYKDFGYDENKLNVFLEKNNAIFITKGHFADNKISISNNLERIINLSDTEVKEINPLLKDMDILLTDYSGAYYDFLLTERPIIFTAFDLEKYIAKNNGLNFEYEKYIAGPITKDWNEVLNSLSLLLEEDTYLNIRKEKNKFFNSYNNGSSSDNLYKYIVQEI